MSETSEKDAELATVCRTLIEKQEKLFVFSQRQSMCQLLADGLAEVLGKGGLLWTAKMLTLLSN